MTKNINQIGINAKKAARILAKTSAEQKNHALQAMSKYVLADKKIILEANKLDIENSKSKNLSESFIDRLELNDERVRSISDTLLEIESFKDPVGKILDSWQRPNGMHISRVSTPLGVIGIIFESRPNVTADAGALSLKDSISKRVLEIESILTLFSSKRSRKESDMFFDLLFSISNLFASKIIFLSASTYFDIACRA